MNAFVAPLAVFFLTISPSIAQTNELAKAQTNAVSLAEATRARNVSLWVHRNVIQRIFGVNVSYSGALVPPSKTRVPPPPPTAPGYPFENVSIHPITGRAEGITLLSIHF